MKSSEAMNELATALSKAQAAFTSPAKTKTAKVAMKSGGNYSFNYADLPQILDCVRKPLTDNGLSVVQGIDSDVDLKRYALHTRLLHSSGQWIEGIYPLSGGGDARPQDRGSELTYARRYALCALIGIAVAETVVHYNRESPYRLSPVVDGGTVGVKASKTF